MEGIIHDEIDKLCSAINASNDADNKEESSAKLNNLLSVSVVNSIWTLLTGEKIPHGDETVKEIVDGEGLESVHFF